MTMADLWCREYFRPWNNLDLQHADKAENKTDYYTKPEIKAAGLETTSVLDLSTNKTNSPEKEEQKDSSINKTQRKYIENVLSEKNSHVMMEHSNGLSPVALKQFPIPWSPVSLQNPMVLHQIQAYCQFVNSLPLMRLQQQQKQQQQQHQQQQQQQQHHHHYPQKLVEEKRHISSKKENSLIDHHENPKISESVNFGVNYNKFVDMKQLAHGHTNLHRRGSHSMSPSNFSQKLSSQDSCNETVEPASPHYPLPTAKDGEPLDLLPKSLYMNKAHGGHLCIFCGKLYSRKYGLKIHLRTHTGYKPLKCKICQRPFGDPSNLNKHIRLHAEGETPYRCNYCGKVLVRRRDLERHIRSRHPGKVDNVIAETESLSPTKLDCNRSGLESDFEIGEELDVVG